MIKVDLEKLDTEKINKDTLTIGTATSIEIVRMMNNEDEKVAKAVREELDSIAKIVDMAEETLLNKGRIVYMGAGNSGRLAVGDACECVPTFGVDTNTVVAVLAGGPNALINAKEGAEDNKEQGELDLREINLTSKDLVIGLSASGRTPYVKGGLSYAREIGCKTSSICCSKNSELGELVDEKVEISVGPEALTGSTRLKAGTAQKMVLNMISTGSMARVGKIYKNYMVDVSVKNEKLFERGKKIISDTTGASVEVAHKYLTEANGNVKVAIVMIKKGISFEEAVRLLEETPNINKLM